MHMKSYVITQLHQYDLFDILCNLSAPYPKIFIYFNETTCSFKSISAKNISVSLNPWFDAMSFGSHA